MWERQLVMRNPDQLDPIRRPAPLIWPHLTGLIAATILLFALGYVLFQQREIRK